MQWAVALACVLAGGAGYCAFACVLERRRRADRLSLPQRGGAHAPDGQLRGDAEGRIVGYLLRLEQRLALGAATGVGARLAASRGGGTWSRSAIVRHAGLAEKVTRAGFAEACVRLGALCAVVGCIVGLALSWELAAAFALVGGAVGAALPSWALRSRGRERIVRLERELPDMLDVLALGLRSGLSFDRSFELYCDHFDTSFSAECAAALSMWKAGLVSRKDALSRIADSYDSPEFHRVVEMTVRSLRLGTSLAGLLEEAAREARAVRKARREEAVAKASVKMMVPTGTLILPAMLIMVLGPVLLELVAGW